MSHPVAGMLDAMAEAYYTRVCYNVFLADGPPHPTPHTSSNIVGMIQPDHTVGCFEVCVIYLQWDPRLSAVPLCATPLTGGENT